MKPRGRTVAMALLAAHAACGFANAVDGEPAPDADAGGAANCSVTLMSMPREPEAGPATTVEVVARSSDPSLSVAHRWRVRLDGVPVTFTPRSDTGVIGFAATAPGVYEVDVDTTPPCSSDPLRINARARGARTQSVRLRVVPSQNADAPPFEKRIQIKGGASAYLDVIAVDPGSLEAISILGQGGGGVAAYAQFSPTGTPDAIVEAFSNSSGRSSVRLALQTYSVLVVPSAAGNAPRRVPGWSFGQPLRIDAGAAITGTVRGPSNTPLAGATVQLTTDGVPSTVATTAADGSFTLRAVGAGDTTTVEVSPPAASGLPRLLASSKTFDLTVPLQIRYDASVALIDLAGTVVQRMSTPIAGAQVAVVGTINLVGTVTTGSRSPVPASGDVRIAATTGANGALPAMPVPSAPLSVVIQVAPGDLAVASLPAAGVLDARLQQSVPTRLLDAQGAALAGATLEVVPIGALEMAGAPTLRFTAGDMDGAIDAGLPSGGHYELRFHDPRGRAAPLIVPDSEATAIAASYKLPVGIRLQGVVRLLSQALPGASVQILCDDTCTGIARRKPLVEVLSDAAGGFTLAVADPGTE